MYVMCNDHIRVLTICLRKIQQVILKKMKMCLSGQGKVNKFMCREKGAARVALVDSELTKNYNQNGTGESIMNPKLK